MRPQNQKWPKKKQTGRGREAQRKELVNNVSLKANKPKGKDVVIGPRKRKRFSKNK